jgi:hypothetical protein
MGKYINQTSFGEPLGTSYESKINGLIRDGAVKIKTPSEFHPNLVCVVDNGHFAAAGYCDSEKEFDAFTYHADNRPKTWLRYHAAEEVAR